jgi:cell fate regulator YaaT (PSP1 superfamily)
MPTAIAVRFRYNPKAFWFDTGGHTVKQGDYVLISRENAKEIGLVLDDPFELTEEEIARLATPLKTIVRVIGEEDYPMLDELEDKGRSALALFREAIHKHGLDMKPVDVDYLVDADAAVFYFSSEERVDFRELVRDLASQLHIHVDMRQIGVRDEARAVGGLGHCGERLCCARLGGEFFPVSIRMAKEQDLPLNPAKVSGACGRLMCCLRYEFEAYKDFKTRAPKVGAIVETPLGQAKVLSFDTPREMVNLRLINVEKPKNFTVPFAEIAIDPEKDKNDKTGTRCACSVSLDTLHTCCAHTLLQELAALDAASLEGASGAANASHAENRRPRRRKDAANNENAAAHDRAHHEGKEAKPSNNNGGNGNASGNRRRRRGKSTSAANPSDAPKATQAPKGQQAAKDPSSSSSSGAHRRSNNQNATKQGSGNTASTSRPRPGQNSSGLRGASSGAASGANASTGSGSGYGNRRRRRSSSDGAAGKEN